PCSDGWYAVLQRQLEKQVVVVREQRLDVHGFGTPGRRLRESVGESCLIRDEHRQDFQAESLACGLQLVGEYPAIGICRRTEKRNSPQARQQFAYQLEYFATKLRHEGAHTCNVATGLCEARYET